MDEDKKIDEIKTGMTIEMFQKTIDIFGADLDRLPPKEAEAARRLLTNSEDARLIYQEAKNLDAFLSSDERPVFNLDQCQKNISKAIDEAQAAVTQDEHNIIDFKPTKPNAQNNEQSAKAANDNGPTPLIAASLLAASLMFGVMFGALGSITLFETDTNISLASNDINEEFLGLAAGSIIENNFFELTENE